MVVGVAVAFAHVQRVMCMRRRVTCMHRRLRACTEGSVHAQKGECTHTGRYSINLEEQCGKIKFTEKKNHILSVKTLGHLITKMSLLSTKQAARSYQCEC